MQNTTHNKQAKRESKITLFKDKQVEYIENTGDEPKVAEISMDMYENLLKVDWNLKEKPKQIATLFGIKIMIDPMLKENEIKFRNDL